MPPFDSSSAIFNPLILPIYRLAVSPTYYIGTMDVYCTNFWRLFPSIVQQISDADYVAIDFEMTGIKSRNAAKTQKPTQDDIYKQSREAAQTFQVIQFGITCIHYNSDQDVYNASSYNFHVSPMFPNSPVGNIFARMVDRILVVSYASLVFLRSNGNRLEDSCIGGVPYLSREDEANTKTAFLCLEKDAARDDIDLESQDDETKAFYYEARNNLELWDKDPNAREYFNIANPHGDRVNRFQQRLVHQLLQNEFPGKFRCYCKFNSFMQVVKENDPIDEKHRTERFQSRQACLKSQRGLRYILEALVGGEFSKYAAELTELDNDHAAARCDLKTCLDRCEQKLKRRLPIIVGHNMLLDLCFMYQTFFETLPEEVEDFSYEIHKLFPKIIDTKHLVTQGKHDMHSVNNLQELYNEAEELVVPVIVNSRPHGVSARRNKAHHAGYDSIMTATLFVKKAWQMVSNGCSSNSNCTDERSTPHTHAKANIRHQEPARIPHWDSTFFQAHGNKLRIGNSGLLELKAKIT